MSELRELFDKIPKRCIPVEGAIRHAALCALLEALVEAMEPEDTPRLAKEWDEAQATIRTLRETCGRWEQRYKDSDAALAEAKAEIERLCRERDEAQTMGMRHRKERDSAELKLETLKAIDKRICADAEVGRLVRRMRPHTALLKTETTY